MLTSEELYQALRAAGLVNDNDRITRIVIDARLREPVRVYLERIDEGKLPRNLLHGIEAEQIVSA